MFSTLRLQRDEHAVLSSCCPKSRRSWQFRYVAVLEAQPISIHGRAVFAILPIHVPRFMDGTETVVGKWSSAVAIDTSQKIIIQIIIIDTKQM